MFPEILDLPVHYRRDKKWVRYLSPQSVPWHNAQFEGVSAAWIVFPHYEFESETRLVPLARSEALRRLIKTCTLSKPLSAIQVGNFVSWLRNLPCYDLTVGQLSDAVSVINKLIFNK